jgi:hypothetical protein
LVPAVPRREEVALASHTVASWNQLIDWFKEVAELRELGLGATKCA